jgi:hypothetical protein
LQQTQVYLGSIVFKSYLTNYKRFSVVYRSHIKRISAYAIRSLAYAEVSKNATLLSLILQIPTKEYVLNYDLL